MIRPLNTTIVPLTLNPKIGSRSGPQVDLRHSIPVMFQLWDNFPHSRNLDENAVKQQKFKDTANCSINPMTCVFWASSLARARRYSKGATRTVQSVLHAPIANCSARSWASLRRLPDTAVFPRCREPSRRASIQRKFSRVSFPHAFITVKGVVDSSGEKVDASYGFTANRSRRLSSCMPVPGEIVSSKPKYIASSNRHFAL